MLGCLAAVLNIMFARRERRLGPSAPSTTAGDGSDSKDHGAIVASTSESEEDAHENSGATSAVASAANNDHAQHFSIVDTANSNNNADPKDHSPTKSKSTAKPSSKEIQRQTAHRRNRAFTHELLTLSSSLLFLPPDRAEMLLPNLDIRCETEDAERELLLRPFLSSLSGREESFRCVALLVFRFLLASGEEKPSSTKNEEEEGQQSASGAASSEVERSDGSAAKMTIVGYDSRVRFAFKSLFVSVLAHFELQQHDSFLTPERAAAYATRKFEALEDGIALRLSLLSQIMQQQQQREEEAQGGKKNRFKLSGQKKETTLGQNAIRGLKIGAAGIAAGTLFAITGGLAAPAIVGGIAALAGASSAVSVVATLLLLPAATTIFGVGGGTLVANKMSKRTAGVEEFEIVKMTPEDDGGGAKGGSKSGKKRVEKSNNPPELSRTVFVSGWLRDEHDFERPFGVTPRNLADRHELFCRYCSVYAPHIVPHCKSILKQWEGKEGELWKLCRDSYGKDPMSLLPFERGPRYDALLTKKEEKDVEELIRALGLPFPAEGIGRYTATKEEEGATTAPLPPAVNFLSDLLESDTIDDDKNETAKENSMTNSTLRTYRAWDFHAEYASEHYVIVWETELLLQLYGCAKKMQRDLAKTAAKEALKKTALHTVMMAVALPAALLSLSNIIDEQWTLVAERSDEAGVLLAQSLLNSNAGHRPISLVGFSFGARMIISCLKELARHQIIWEQHHIGRKQSESKVVSSLKKSLNISNKAKGDQVAPLGREPASIIEDVVLMGCPASVNATTWNSCRDIVGGRLINCYSKNDMILALMYRVKNFASSLLTAPVGISDVNVAGVENFDVSTLVASHGDYCVAVREILNLVGYDQPAKFG